MENAPLIGETMAKQQVKLGGFSGLQYISRDDSSFYFQTITDRGPNGEIIGNERPFLLPEYSPKIVTLRADLKTKELVVVSEINLKKKDGSALSGLPNARTEENPIDIFGLYYSIDKDGLDTEGLVSDGSGGWWVSDEYGPSIIHFSPEGKMTKRLSPGVEIPRMYSERKMNRGFEGIAFYNNKVFGFLQSPLLKESHAELYKNGVFSRIAEIDLETMKTSAEYFYPFEGDSDKIGDAVSIAPKTFLVLEQNGKNGDKAQHAIYRIKLGESDNLVEKKLVADLKNTPFGNYEKVEGLTFIDNHHLALAYDNDFGIAGDSDLKSGKTPLEDRKNQILLLEFKDDLLLK
jgi:3-phytase